MTMTIKKLSIFTLCLIMTFTCIPMFGSAVYADEGEVTEETVLLPAEQQAANKEKAISELEDELGIVDEEDTGDQEEDALAAEPVSDRLNVKPVSADGLNSLGQNNKGFDLNAYDEETGGLIYVSEPNDSGYVTISGQDLTGSGLTYQEIYIGGDPNYISDVNDLTLLATLGGTDQYYFTKQLDMKQFDVGYHTIYVTVSDGSEIKYAHVEFVPTYIYQKVSNPISNYYTYVTKFSYRYTDSTYYSKSDEYLNMYMDYKKKGGKWSKYVYRMDSSYTDYAKKGLKANGTYKVRQMLGKTFEYKGETYTFTGRQTGYASSARTIKTAYKKPKVKKIDISKVKQYCRKYRYQYAWRIWYRNGIEIRRKALYHTYRYWYTRFKVTVRFSKKQGIAGVHIYTINNLNWRLGGNKKSYSKTFTASGKKKGKKITVKVQNYRSKKYGGWSKKLSKKVRCR